MSWYDSLFLMPVDDVTVDELFTSALSYKLASGTVTRDRLCNKCIWYILHTACRTCDSIH